MKHALNPLSLLFTWLRKHAAGSINVLAFALASLLANATWAVPPTVSMTGPADGSSYVAPASFVLSAVATPGEGNTISSVIFHSPLGTANATYQGNNVYSVSISNEPAGTRAYWAVATDNTGATTTSGSITLTIAPHIPPTVTLSAPANGSTYLAPARFTVVAAAAAASPGTLTGLVFYLDGSPYWTGSNDGTGNFSLEYHDIVAGTHTITAVVTDNGGGTTTSAPITVVVGPHIPPTVTLSAPANGSTYVAPARFTVVAAAAASSPWTLTGLVFYLDGSPYWTGSNDGNGNFALEYHDIVGGTHTITAVVTDNSGVQTVSAPLTVVVTDIPPTVNITGPANNATYAAPAGFTVTGNAADSDGLISYVELRYDGAPYANVNPSISGEWSQSFANIPAGTHTIIAIAHDNGGATTSSATLTLSVHARVPPTVSVTPPPGVLTSPATITLTANASDSIGISQVQFFNGATPIGEAFLASGTVTSGSYVTNAWTNVAAGTYAITAVATDNDGNSATSTPVSVTVGVSSSGANTTLYFIGADHLNTPRLVEDQNQQPVWKWDQAEPFGDSVPNQQPASAGAFVFNLRFPGQYADQETGTSYNYFRDYSPADGKYVQSDPIGLNGGLNAYTYAYNIPLSLADIYGLDPGDRFKTPDDAAIDAGNWVRRTFPGSRLEYGGWIYSLPDQCYSYNWRKGGPFGITDSQMYEIKPATAVRIWHAHVIWNQQPIDTNNAQFSGSPDIPGSGDRRFASENGMPIYLNTPQSTNKVYFPPPSNSEAEVPSRKPVKCDCGK